MQVDQRKKLGKRQKIMWEDTGLSLIKFAKVIGSTQPSNNRYENGQAMPPVCDNPELVRFMKIYFDPGSSMNMMLKQTMLQMLKEV